MCSVKENGDSIMDQVDSEDEEDEEEEEDDVNCSELLYTVFVCVAFVGI